MTRCPTVEVINIKTGKTLVVNESDFNPALHKRGSTGNGAGVKASAPIPFKKKAARSRKDNR